MYSLCAHSKLYNIDTQAANMHDCYNLIAEELTSFDMVSTAPLRLHASTICYHIPDFLSNNTDALCTIIHISQW